MCLILFAYQQHEKWPLVLAANRDEFYDRPTKPLHWWEDSPSVLAGRDLQAGGTWMGVSRTGRFAAVTNVREPEEPPGSRSRGDLVRGWLQTSQTIDEYIAGLEDLNDFSGFNLLLLGPEGFHYLSNRDPRRLLRLTPGIYGLSNHWLDSPWPKVQRGKQAILDTLNHPELPVEPLWEYLADAQLAADDQLPSTGVTLETERRLSAANVEMEDYGTRSSTLLTVHRDDGLWICERQRNEPPREERLTGFTLSTPGDA